MGSRSFKGIDVGTTGKLVGSACYDTRVRVRVRVRVVTDRQTDKIPIANTRSQQYLPVQLSRVKSH